MVRSLFPLIAPIPELSNSVSPPARPQISQTAREDRLKRYFRSGHWRGISRRLGRVAVARSPGQRRTNSGEGTHPAGLDALAAGQAGATAVFAPEFPGARAD